MTDVPDLARLVKEARWLQALARSLVADVHLADDLAQDALVAALEHHGGHHGPVGAWRGFLATSLRRRLFERRREGAARTERERRAAPPEALPSTLAMIERAGVQRDLVQAVLELDEPYRTAILWRFFEELAPREIARRSGAPVATVNTRIQRGLALLRERLARRHGAAGDTDRGWVLALLPLLSPTTVPVTPAVASPLFPAVLMKASTPILVCALLLAGGALVTWQSQRPAAPALASPAATLAAPGTDVEPESARSVPGPLAETAPEREVVPSAVPTVAESAGIPPARAVRLVSGRALDAYGRGLSGVELVARPGDERFRSGSGGRFALELAAAALTLESADERYATVLAGAASTTAETGSVVVLAPRLELAGRVLDEAGTGLAGAELALRLPAGFGADFGLALDGALTQQWGAVAGPDGAFRLGDVPWVEGARLAVHLGGFEPSEEPLPGASRDDLWLTLVRVRAATELVRGTVELPEGGPAAGARVAFGTATTVADARGSFELAAAAGERPAEVLALLPGFLPARATREELGGDWPAELELVLGGKPLAIGGRVLGPDGQGVARARVWLAEPTWFGGVEGDVTSVEALVASDDRRFWAYVETAEDGSFLLAGLAARAFRLKAVDAESLLLLESGPIAAGTRDVELRFPAGAVHERLRGHVVGADGAGIPGVSVKVQRPAMEYAFPDGGTRDQFTVGQEATTDEEGGFEFRNVPREGVELFGSSDAILFTALQVDRRTDPEDVTLRAERRIHLQVELRPPHERADTVRALDGDGQRLLLRIMRGSTSQTNTFARLEDGRSHVLSLSERARWVVLYRGDVEVARLPFAPTPMGVNTVSW